MCGEIKSDEIVPNSDHAMMIGVPGGETGWRISYDLMGT